MSPGCAPVASCLSGRLSKVSRWSDPGSFQVTASSLGFCVCESCVCPLGAESLFPRVLWASRMHNALLAFKDRGSEGFSSHCRPQDCGACCGTQTPSLLRGTSAVAIIFSSAGHPPPGVRVFPTTPQICLSFPPHRDFFPCVFSCRSFLLDSGPSAEWLFWNFQCFPCRRAFPGGSVSQEAACSAGDPGSIPGSGRSPGEGNGKPLQDSSCLENSMDRGVWGAIIHGATESQT